MGVIALLLSVAPGGSAPASATDRARDEIERLIAQLFDGEGWTKGKRELFANPRRYAEIVGRPRGDALTYRRRIQQVFFVSATEAAIALDGWSGFTAELVDGRWRLGLGAACAINFRQSPAAKKQCFDDSSKSAMAARGYGEPTVASIGAPPRRSAATAALIAATVETFLKPSTNPIERAGFFEDGEDMEPVVRESEWLFNDWKRVRSVVFTSPTSADVSYRSASRSLGPLTADVRRERVPKEGLSLLDVVKEGERWKVRRFWFCEQNENIALWCPAGHPVPTPRPLRAPRTEVGRGFPHGLPKFVAVDDTGSLWVVHRGRAERWSDSGALRGDAESHGYRAAKFGPDGEIYALRGEWDGRLAIDRFRRPGRPIAVIEERSVGGDQRDIGYVVSFSVGRHGIALLLHQPTPSSYCAGQRDCERSEGWFLEVRPFGRLDRAGRRSRSAIDEFPFGGNGTLGLGISDESEDGAVVGVTSFPNKAFASHALVDVATLRSRACCESLSDPFERDLVLSPTADRAVFVRASDAVAGRSRTLPAELQAMDASSGAIEVLYRPRGMDTTKLGKVLDWTNGYIAFVGGAKASGLRFLEVDEHELFVTDFTFGGIRSLDFGMS